MTDPLFVFHYWLCHGDWGWMAHRRGATNLQQSVSLCRIGQKREFNPGTRVVSLLTLSFCQWVCWHYFFFVDVSFPYILSVSASHEDINLSPFFISYFLLDSSKLFRVLFIFRVLHHSLRAHRCNIRFVGTSSSLDSSVLMRTSSYHRSPVADNRTGNCEARRPFPSRFISYYNRSTQCITANILPPPCSFLFFHIIQTCSSSIVASTVI